MAKEFHFTTENDLFIFDRWETNRLLYIMLAFFRAF